MKFRKMMGVTAAFLCAALALSGCGSTDETAYRIGIVQQDEHSSLDAATQGFEDKLMELLGEENVTFDYQNAQGEQANCTTIATKFVSDGVTPKYNAEIARALGITPPADMEALEETME